MSKIEVNQISSQCGSTLTIGQSGDTVTLACGATQTGFGRTGTVDWCTTAKTAPFTGVSGKGYFVNTTCAAVTVTLPATPSAGDIISIKDYARTAATNNISFCRNGSKMDCTCDSGSISTNGESTTLIYVDGTKGWTSILDSTTNAYGAQYIAATGGTIVTCGDYKTHIFTADGCFSVSNAGNPGGSDTVDYLIVAGGGGSGASCASGGGGAGGFRVSNFNGLSAPTMSPLSNPTGVPVSTTTYPITVGGGGSGGTGGTPPISACSTLGTNGSPSVFSTITSAGGGRSGAYPTTPTQPGNPGGSGGGGAHSAGTGGSGNTPPVSPPQGNDGAAAGPSTITSDDEGGGGGGAGAVGGNPIGGIGSYISDSFIGPTAPSYGEAGPVSSTRYFGGGGGGAVRNGPNAPHPPLIPQIVGGIGGGGDGGIGQCTGTYTGSPGCTNMGGGAGGSTRRCSPVVYGNGATGGSGIVIIRYKFQ
jgi:hypothetical protein